MLTLTTRDLDGIPQRAADAGFQAPAPQEIAASPYDNRRTAVLRGPAGERVELVDTR